MQRHHSCERRLVRCSGIFACENDGTWTDSIHTPVQCYWHAFRASGLHDLGSTDVVPSPHDVSYLGRVRHHRTRRCNAGHDGNQLHLVETRAWKQNTTLRGRGGLRLERLRERPERIPVLHVELREVIVAVDDELGFGRRGCFRGRLGAAAFEELELLPERVTGWLVYSSSPPPQATAVASATKTSARFLRVIVT